MRALLLSLAVLWSFLTYAQTNDRFLVKPYLQFSTQTGMYVLWETREPATAEVRFGEARLGATRAILDQRAALPGAQTMHEVFLPSLKPETNYFWQAVSVVKPGDTLKSEVYSFKTAVQDSSAFMFALIGDTQRNSRTPWAWKKIAEKVWADRPHFVVLAGDLVDKGLIKEQWTDMFFPDGHVLMSRVPVYPVLGNHEQDAPFYYQYIVAPEPEYYYTFTYGNAQFFMLDTNRPVHEGSEQYEWLDWALAQSTALWKIAVHHHPPYSSDSDDHGNAFTGRSTLGTSARNLVPLYEQYGVDFCLFGHTHLYERTWPIKDNRVNLKEGVVYINSGGAGGGIEDFTPTRNWFTVELEAVHHYCTFNVFENRVIFKAIDHEGKLLDMFQMEKPLLAPGRASLVQPPAPHIASEGRLFEEKTGVRLDAAFEGLTIRYTLDGTEPTSASQTYTSPLVLDRSALLQARAFTADGKASRVVSESFRKMAPQPAAKVKNLQRGLRFSYYEGEWQRLPDFSTLTPLRTGVAAQVSLTGIDRRENHFGLVLEGYVDVPTTGLHTFFINSDDGSKLYLNGELVIDHDGDHSAISRTGQAMLAAGKHKLRIEYFEATGGEFLQAGRVDPALGEVPFTPFQLSY